MRRPKGKKDRPGHGKSKEHEKVVHPEPGAGRRRTLKWLRWAAGTALVLSLALMAGFYGLDRELKVRLEFDYCVDHQQWNDVLVKASNMPLKFYSQYVNHDVNRALYHTGQLTSQMFAFPQRYWPLLSVHQVSSDVSEHKNYERMYKLCDLLLELGRINEAEHTALELQEMRPSGGTLKRLALVEMIKGQSAAARVFLNVLRDDLVWGRWAKGYLQLLARDPNLAGDQEIQQARRMMISKDDVSLTDNILPGGGLSHRLDVYLLKLLEQNHQNRMAFEYLMAMYLFNNDVAAVVDSLSLLDNFSYSAVPPLYEEAVMIYGSHHTKELKATNWGLFFRGRKISEPTMKRFRRLQAIVNSCGGPNAKARPLIARELGDSYFYYFFYTPRKRS
jgi:hypothetical protein